MEILHTEFHYFLLSTQPTGWEIVNILKFILKCNCHGFLNIINYKTIKLYINNIIANRCKTETRLKQK